MARAARAAGGCWVGARARVSGSWAQAQAGGSGARGVRGRALGARPGRAGWPRAVHSVHSACFLARFDSVFFLSQIFGHCS